MKQNNYYYIGKRINFRHLFVAGILLLILSVLIGTLWYINWVSVKWVVLSFILSVGGWINIIDRLQYPNILITNIRIEIHYYNSIFYHSFNEFKEIVYFPSLIMTFRGGKSWIYLCMKSGKKYPLAPHDFKMLLLGQKRYYENISETINSALREFEKERDL